ncbi:MAG: stage III sporulation protein AD [Firmicutes bacterium]|nr:stage III sporulation protein AD [Bacillota bacterium]MCL2255865.1 stage III sporulation protein AD [Bacillota bacterium]
MDIIQIAGIGIITAFSVILLRENKSEVALLIGIAGGLLIVLSVVDYFADIFGVIRAISDRAGIPNQLFSTIVRIIVIGYIADFSAGIVEDAGLKSVSEKVILGGKLLIMALALPIVVMLFDTVAELIS